jgi:mannose-1-phosphate guanylyltransferase/mannose-6-phosphate isomerase
MHVVILAGGLGSRLWPLSRGDFPKQFLQLGGADSLLKQTVNRISKHPEIQTIVVSTNNEIESLVREDLAGFDVEILVEPYRRSTAPAVALAIRYLEEICGIGLDEPILVLPSDHFIHPECVFLDYLTPCLARCREGEILTFGIQPTKPETGYGYVRTAEKLDSFCYRVDAFVEKPPLARAQQYLKDPHYYWNTGMIAFTAAIFWSELEMHCPQIACLKRLVLDEILVLFQSLEAISIDCAVLEKSKRVVVCPLPIFWTDIGCWEAVHEILDKDQNLNVKIGNVVALDTKNCLIIGGKRVISTIGLEDLVIVDTDDAILISRKSDSQRVKVPID